MVSIGKHGTIGPDWGGKADLVTFGHLVALLVLLAAFVLYITGKMDGVSAAMFGGLAFSIFLTAWPMRWGPTPV